MVPQERPPYAYITSLIQQEARITYKIVGKSRGVDPSNVYRHKFCYDVSCDLREGLTRQGLSVILVEHEYNREIFGDMYHAYLYLKDFDLFVDGTWQQFLERPRKDLPKVLTAKRSEMKEVLIRYGVPQNRHHIWLTHEI